MFLDLESRMKSMYSTSEQYVLKAERTFSSWISILKSFANSHFLKVVIGTVSFLPSDIFFFWVSEEKKELSFSQTVFNKDLLYTHKVLFCQQKIIAVLSTKKSDYWYI